MNQSERFPALRTISVVVLALSLLPALYLIIRAPQSAPLAVLRDVQTWSAAGKSLGIALGAALLCCVLSLPLAWIAHASDVPARRVFRVLLVLPLAVPSYVSGFVIIALLGTRAEGYLGALLALSFTFPFVFLSLRAALARLDPRLWESARSLGASPWRAFWRVVFPQLRPSLAHGALLVGLYAAGDFGAVSLTRYESLSYLIYLRYQTIYDRTEAIVLGLLLAVIVTILVIVLLRVGGSTARAGARQLPREWPTVALGVWRWPAFALCAVVSGLGVVLPVAIVGAWLVRGLRLDHDIVLPVVETLSSSLVAGVAAVVIVLAATAPSVLNRFGGGRGRVTRLTSHIGYALPGIVVALALVSFASQSLSLIYQTFVLLIAAYMIRFLPLAVDTLDDALTAQNPSIFAAARSLGCTSRQALWRAVLPNVRPALAIGFLAVFIAVLKELPVTLLLAPIGFDTLATDIWSLTEDAYFSLAAPAVIALLVLAAGGVLLQNELSRGIA